MKDLFDVQQLSQFEFGAIIITVLVAGLVLGCLLGYTLLKRKNTPNEQAAAALAEEFEQYKDKVDEHFNQTSEMFKDVTTQYKKLYDHMAVGAIELSKADTITMPRLEMQESQEPEPLPDDVIEDDVTHQTPTVDDEISQESHTVNDETVESEAGIVNESDTPDEQKPDQQEGSSEIKKN